MTNLEAATAVTPQRIFETLLYGRMRADALKAAIDLDVFTAIAEGARRPAELASRCGADARGLAVLCDFLCVDGFLARTGDAYELRDEARVFLDRHSPAYAGSVAAFLSGPGRIEASARIGDAVRRGGAERNDALVPDAAAWVSFAETMLPVVGPVAGLVAQYLGASSAGPLRVLDVAAGHGEFGIAIARANLQASIDAVDWPAVLSVAERRADAAGIGSRFRAVPGDIFELPLEGSYDLILLPNFVHHFAPDVCARLLRKLHAALVPGGRLATVEFVPNDDRVSPAWPAMFGLVMLTMTPAGRTYTLPELLELLEDAGFSRNTAFALKPTPQTLVVSLTD